MLSKDKLVEYSGSDPRFNFTITDSSHYGIAILPLQLKQLCVNGKYANTKGDTYNDFLVKPIDELEDELSDISDFVPKKLNNNVFYSDTMISKIDNPDLEIDRSPDTNINDMIYNRDMSNVTKASDIDLNKDIKEHFGGLDTIPNKTLVLVIVILVIIVCLLFLCISCCM